jgi:hypothetical protein
MIGFHLRASPSPSPADRLLQFVIEHETCEPETLDGSLEREPNAVEFVLRCPGCGATLTVPVTVADAQAFVSGRDGHYSDDDIRRAQANVSTH